MNTSVQEARASVASMPGRSVCAIVLACAALYVACFDWQVVPNDGGSDADASAAGFCASKHHDVCKDFDDGQYPPWTSEIARGGRLAIDGDASRSAPSSLLAGLPDSGSGPYATLHGKLPNPASHVICEFVLRIDALTPGPAGIGVFQLSATGADVTSYIVVMGLSGGKQTSSWEERGTRADGGALYAFKGDLAIPEVGVWKSVRVDAQLSAAGGTLSVDVGGNTIANLTLAAFAGAFDGVTIGAIASNAVTGPTGIRFDDVACDAVGP